MRKKLLKVYSTEQREHDPVWQQIVADHQDEIKRGGEATVKMLAANWQMIMNGRMKYHSERKAFQILDEQADEE